MQRQTSSRIHGVPIIEETFGFMTPYDFSSVVSPYLKKRISRVRMVKAIQAGQIKQIMQIKQDKCRSSRTSADQADHAGENHIK
ncbi:hypothetical protein YC2023_086682 [Brassica napus]